MPTYRYRHTCHAEKNAMEVYLRNANTPCYISTGHCCWAGLHGQYFHEFCEHDLVLICNKWSGFFYYSTGVQIVSCTLSDDSVLSESTGLFNPVLCVSQWNLFWQKNQPMRLCLSNQVRSAREWFPSPLGDFIRLFEGLIGELFQIWHWNMFYFFKWHQSGP